jgi:phage terminase small subunit
MPVLDNPRHERFAQELAKGKSASEAYAAAGYEPNDGNCIRLKGNERVNERVSELQGRAAERVEITVAGISRELLEIAKRSKTYKTPAGEQAARAALMDAATLNGLVISKSEVRRETVDLTEAELERRIKQLDAAQTGDNRGETGTAGAPRGERTAPTTH